VAGWAMLLGYICMPLINVIYGAVTLRREFPALPYWAGALGFALLITALNLRGIRWTARANELIAAVNNLDRFGPVSGLRRLLQA